MMGVFDIFKRSAPQKEKQKVVPYDIPMWRYRTFDGKILEMDLIRACVDALARNIAKMDMKAVILKSDGKKKIDTTSDVARVLKHPNPYMSKYDFLYKCASMYYTSNNVFIYPEYDDMGNLLALHPINYQNFHLVKTKSGTLVAQFQISYASEYTIPYRNLIHLRNHYTTDDFFGDANTSLDPVAELLNAQNQGIINGIKNSAIIRGILKAANVIKQDELIKARDKFIEDNLQASNNGGVIVIDGKFDYSSIESKPYIVDDKTMEQAKSKVFNYFGVNEAFLQNSFTADQYEAVYEGRLEPFAEMFCEAMTYGLFTDRERGFGNEIQASLTKMRYQTIGTITGLIGATNQLGLFTRNEYREMIGYAPLDDDQGGNEIMISLNYTKQENLDEYQDVIGKDDENESED